MKSPLSEQSISNTVNQTHSGKKLSDFWKTIRINIKSQHQAPTIKPVLRNGNLPLSFVQERLWFLNQLQPDTSIHNMRAAFRLKGPLNIAALKQSLREIVRRHEILRTTFTAVNGKPIQVISPNIDLKLPVIDLREVPESEQKIQVEQITRQEFEQPFHLAQGPLCQFKLLRLAEEEYVFLRTVHHIVFDGWSYSVFMRELAVIYEAFSSGKPSPLSDLPIQYADFAQSQRQWLQDKVLESQLNYWKQQLSGSISSIELPIDHPRPSTPTYRGDRESLVLPKNLTENLKVLSVQEGVSLYVTLLAAFKTLLHRYIEQEDIIICSPVAGRNRVETKKLIGYFNNIVPMRTYLGENPSFRELMGRVSQVTLAAYEHQELPFQKIVDCSNIPSTSLYRVVFALQNTPLQPLKLGDINISYLDVSTEASNFELFLSLIEEEGNLTGVLTYKTDLFDATTITQMLENFQSLLERLVANSNQHLSDLPLLRNPEFHQPEYKSGSVNKTKQELEETFCSPRDELELQLAKIWEKVLGVQSISIKDNFFDLGGQSLLAVRLFTEIEKEFGKNLPLAILFQAPTVEELANIIRKEKWLAPWNSLVAIQPKGSKTPLFYMHAGGGNLLVYRDLALSLDPEQPVYGLQPRGLEGKYDPFNRIEDMADHYLASIRSIQPDGPYFLAGLSQGGVIAWEIAQRLHAQGQKVALLALFDAFGPGYPQLLPPVPRLLSVLNWALIDFKRRLFRHNVRLPAKVIVHLTQFIIKDKWLKKTNKLGVTESKISAERKNKRDIDDDHKIQKLVEQRWLEDQLDKYKCHSRNIGYLEKWINSLSIFILKKSSKPFYADMLVGGLARSLISSLPESLQKVQEANRQAGETYVPQSYPGKAILFRASERSVGIYRDPQLGWGNMATGGLEIHEVPGSHDSIVKSPVLAKKLRACIEAAQADLDIGE